MSTVNFGFTVSETTKRRKQTILSSFDSLADVESLGFSKKTLTRGESFIVTPKRFFAVSINTVKILIRITVDTQIITLPMQSSMYLPIEEGTVVSIEIENPTDNTVLLPAVVSYITV